ncbi:peroxisome biogenesis factor 10 [Xylographa opegraphella]|nr:peroxisome biogenesis factor 10 [Xylographa opegraphella]
MKSPDGRSDTVLEAPSISNLSNGYQYPFAAAPDIIRSNQKDTYFQGVLLENLSDIIRKLYGARFSHKYTSEARTFTELLYLACTTLLGNRTLGEEYCDVIQVEEDSLQFPSICRRAGYILSTILLPYVLSKALPSLRNRLRLKLESNLQSNDKTAEHASYLPLSKRLQKYLLSNLSTLTSPSPFYAISLSLFYFSGAYYHISKRILGLRYIFTKRLEPSEQRIGYEVLGVLLVLQMTVQGWLHFRNTIRSTQPSLANAASIAGGAAVIDGGIELSLDSQAHGSNNNILLEDDLPRGEDGTQRLGHHTHTPVLARPRYELNDMGKLGWIDGSQQRKCTLCLEELKDPSVTTCGHVFCWLCIADWIREKPECPLCRQAILSQHVLPLRG